MNGKQRERRKIERWEKMRWLRREKRRERKKKERGRFHKNNQGLFLSWTTVGVKKCYWTDEAIFPSFYSSLSKFLPSLFLHFLLFLVKKTIPKSKTSTQHVSNETNRMKRRLFLSSFFSLFFLSCLILTLVLLEVVFSSIVFLSRFVSCSFNLFTPYLSSFLFILSSLFLFLLFILSSSLTLFLPLSPSYSHSETNILVNRTSHFPGNIHSMDHFFFPIHLQEGKKGTISTQTEDYSVSHPSPSLSLFCIPLT